MGILGAAGIAATFMRGIQGSEAVRVCAIASRDGDKARAFAQTHGIEHAYGSYEELLRDPHIAAVYNPLPNSLHAQWTIAALQAGKHVLCEKPLALTPEEAERMFAAARSAGRVLVEGYPYRYQPIMQRLQALIVQGEIGRVQMIQAYFGFIMANATNIRLSTAMGGGSLGDAGSYPLSLVRMVAARRPRSVTAAATWTGTGVDNSVVAQFEFDQGLLAQVACSFGTAPSRHALIAGSGGIIETNFLNHPPADQPASLLLRRGTSWETANTYETVTAPAVNGFRAEADAFAGRISDGASDWNGTSPEESLDIAYMIAATQRSMASGRREAV